MIKVTNGLINILLLCPGIVGIAAANLINGDNKTPGLSEGIVKYFLYSCASWIIAELFMPGYVLSKVLQGDKIQTLEVFYPILAALIIGICWNLFLKKMLLFGANLLNKVFNRNQVFLSESILADILCDNKYHFLEVKKDNEIIAKGYITKRHGNEKALVLVPDDEYIDCGYTEKTKQYIVYLKDGIVIREYDYKELSDK